VSRENQSLCRRDIRIWDSAYNSMPDHSILWHRVGSTQNLVESRTVPSSGRNWHFGISCHDSRVLLKPAIGQIRMPNPECRKKSEVRSPKPTAIACHVRKPRDTQKAREGICHRPRSRCDASRNEVNFGVATGVNPEATAPTTTYGAVRTRRKCWSKVDAWGSAKSIRPVSELVVFNGTQTARSVEPSIT
jgi:hypothetical protein